MPSDETSFIEIHFVPNVFEALFRHVCRNFEIVLVLNVFTVLLEVRMNSLEISLKFWSLHLHLFAFLAYLLEQIFLFCFLLVLDFGLFLGRLFLSLVNEIVKFDLFLIGSDDLCWGVLKEVHDSSFDSGLNFEVWRKNLVIHKFPETELLGTE